jgi:hypothetical protein
VVHAWDTEVVGIDLDSQSPVGHGRVICASFFSGPGVDYGSGPRVWVDADGEEGDAVLRAFGGVLGAVAGALAGNAIERNATREESQEIMVQLRNGERRAIVQARGGENLQPGDSVIIVTNGGKVRVTRAPATTLQVMPQIVPQVVPHHSPMPTPVPGTRN